MSLDFQPYLESIRKTYADWQRFYTPTDAAGKQRRSEQESSTFDFGLMVQSVRKEERREEETIGRFPVLEGIRRYAEQHVLLVGRPGSRKSTALARLMLEEATTSQDKIPILVELRYWQGSIEQLILDSLTRHDPKIKSLDQVLLRSLMLFDGVNELPSDDARSQLSAFRRNHPRVPMIFTTRDLSIGGDLGIEKRLEMQPLTEKQMEAFIRSYVPEQAEKMLRQLGDRLREFGQTPLLLWILCEVMAQSPDSNMPTNLGNVFQVFTQAYEKSSVRKHEVAALKGDVRPLSDRRVWKKALKSLAWLMMQGETPVDFRVVIHRDEAEREFSKIFPNEPFSVRDILDDLLNYHLLQNRSEDQIEFRHQLIQEYYAAELLVEQFSNLTNDEIKQNYLNYLKWTEPIAMTLMLASRTQAIKLVQLALLEVDLMLGAKLIGKVEKIQESTIHFLSELEMPELVRIKLLEQTGSDKAVPKLVEALKHADPEVRQNAASALGKLKSDSAIPGLLQTIKDPNCDVSNSAIFALGLIGSTSAINCLLQALSNSNSVSFDKATFEEGSDLNRVAESMSFKNSTEEAELSPSIADLLKLLEDPDCDVSQSEIYTLGEEGSEADLPQLIQLLNHTDAGVRWCAAVAIVKIAQRVGSAACSYLPSLARMVFSSQGLDALQAILGIQEDCKYYNYEIYQAHLRAQKHDRQTQKLDRSQTTIASTITIRTERLTLMTDKAPIFNQQNATIGVNYAAEGSKQDFTQHINATEQNFEILLTSYKQFIDELHQENPLLTDEAEITRTINIEAKRIDARWQNFLNLKRLWNGSKKAAVKVGEHFVESNPWGKGAIAFLEGISEDVK